MKNLVKKLISKIVEGLISIIMFIVISSILTVLINGNMQTYKDSLKAYSNKDYIKGTELLKKAVYFGYAKIQYSFSKNKIINKEATEL